MTIDYDYSQEAKWREMIRREWELGYIQNRQLFEPDEMVTDDKPGETFWKAKNGIRLTGMPSFAAALSEQQIWQVSLLLANADKLPASVQQALAAPVAATSPAK